MPALAMKQAAVVLVFVLLSRAVVALPSDLLPRGDVDPCLNEAPTLDGPTSDQSAGLGVEFESSGVILTSPKCNQADTNQAKGKQIGDRKGTNWKLTADTTQDIPGSLTAEYILNGQTIRIGTGAASAAAAAVSSDVVRNCLLTSTRHIQRLMGLCRSHGTHTLVCLTIIGTLKATNAIRGQSQDPTQVMVRVT